MTLREHPVQDISSLLNNLRSQHSHFIPTGSLIGDPNTDHPQSPLTHAIHNLACTLNIPSCQYYLANPRPTDVMQHARYIRAATICPCPVTKITNPGTPRMCEYCDLLHQVIRKSPTNDCPACAMPHTDANDLSTCLLCVLYALVHQNTFDQRWNDIQTSLTATRQQKVHSSLIYPKPVKNATPPRDKGRPSVLVLATKTDTTQTRTNIVINLTLTARTLGAIQQILRAIPTTNQCTIKHISHPALTLTMTQLHSLNGLIEVNLDQNLSHLVIFHHLHITVMSTIIPSDITLKITLDNTIHILTLPRTGSVTTPHHLHLYLNPHDPLPYLQHTCTGNKPTPYHLVATASLPCQRSGSSWDQRRPILRTTAYAPGLDTTLTFSVESTQHQQSILTLATHLLLTVPVITRQQSWNSIREKESHRLTLQLILAAVTLKRYHIIWYTVINDPPVTQPIPQIPTDHSLTRPKRHAILIPRHRPPKR